MQAETPKLVDLSNESKATHQLYGVGAPATDRNAKACLLARRLSEAAKKLAQGAPDILSIALEAGYSSHEPSPAPFATSSA